MDWVTQARGADVLRWVIALSLRVIAGWMLIPDEIDDNSAASKRRFVVFGSTAVTLFLAEKQEDLGSKR